MGERERDSLLASGDTIVAVATATGRAGIGIVRISGPEAAQMLGRRFRSAEPQAPRRARFGRFLLGDGGPALDQVVATFFPGPASYTGEDLVEVGAHGNPLILNEIVVALEAVGARRARRGEFTRRAVANGRMDLAQAEAVRDFIESETLAQARTALEQLEGGLSRRVRPVRDDLVALVAELEAGLDFPEDETGGGPASGLADRMEAQAADLESLAASFDYGRVLREGVLVAILGRPNVGKSSLFNRLLSLDRAIVSDLPGTTRDVVTETIEISGIPVRLADTAGMRLGGDQVEALGVERTRETAAAADLTLIVLDGSRPLEAFDLELLDRARSEGLVVVNKSDLEAAWAPESLPVGALSVSARSGAGLGELRAAIQQKLVGSRPPDSEVFAVTSRRHRDALRSGARAIRHAARASRSRLPVEMLLVDLYAGLESLGEVTGEVTTEDILDQIFSTFCIGK